MNLNQYPVNGLAQEATLRIIAVIPGDPGGNSMIFAKRQVDSLEKSGAEIRRFFLASRTSPRVILAEVRRFRRLIRDFHPDFIHAQYGTVTAASSGLAWRGQKGFGGESPRIPEKSQHFRLSQNSGGREAGRRGGKTARGDGERRRGKI